MEKAFLIDVLSKIYVATDSSPVDMQTYELCSDMIDVVVDVSCIYGYSIYLSICLSILYLSMSSLSSNHLIIFLNRTKEENQGLAYDEETQSIIKLNNGMVLYLREVNRFLALVCLLREDNFDKHGNYYLIYYHPSSSFLPFFPSLSNIYP